MVELIGKEDIKLSKQQVHELIELIDKEEILEVDEQIQKTLQKETETKSSETKYVSPKSPVPATPVTTEKGYGKEELDEDYSPRSSDQERGKTAAVLKSNSTSDSVRNPPLAPGVPPTAKKAEGSNHARCNLYVNNTIKCRNRNQQNGY